MDEAKDSQWTEIILPQRALFDVRIAEIFKYRSLITMFVKRDLVSGYKQTILGPLWYVIQPILTTFVYLLVFGNIARISTDGIPALPFYLLGVVSWGYFSTCLNRTAGTFLGNAGIFGKVYFPRLTVPISTLISSFIFFVIQLALFLLVWGYYLIAHPGTISPNSVIFLSPYILFLMACLGLGLGIIISSITIKYRDFNFLLAFGVQLWMYASPIIYPSSEITKQMSKHSFALWINHLNPVTPMIETLRYGFLGHGVFSIKQLIYSSIITFLILFIGVIVFNKAENTFVDVI